jgi:hypothetical protein
MDGQLVMTGSDFGKKATAHFGICKGEVLDYSPTAITTTAPTMPMPIKPPNEAPSATLTSMPTASPTKKEDIVGTPTNPPHIAVGMPTETPGISSEKKDDRVSQSNNAPRGLSQVQFIAILVGGAFIIAIIVAFCMHRYYWNKRRPITLSKDQDRVIKTQQTSDTEDAADLEKVEQAN